MRRVRWKIWLLLGIIPRLIVVLRKAAPELGCPARRSISESPLIESLLDHFEIRLGVRSWFIGSGRTSRLVVIAGHCAIVPIGDYLLEFLPNPLVQVIDLRSIS